MSIITKIKKELKKNHHLVKLVKFLRRKTTVPKIKKTVSGIGNKFNYQNAMLLNVTFDIVGNNNTIDIGKDCSLNNVVFYIRGNNNKIILHEEVKYFVSGTFWTAGNNGHIDVGKNTTAQHNVNIQIAEDNRKILVGENCMFSSNISVWAQDWHPIFDKNGNRINIGKDVIIKDRVWIGYDVKILKGVTIGKNNIVGTNAVITKSFTEENIIIAGNPGKIIKRDIEWRS